MDKTYWEKIYRTCKEYGLNHVRFHSWCPPEIAFDVADNMGIYLQVECGAWAEVGSGKPQDQWIKEESDRILKEYGNHPSFCMMCYGNEPAGDNLVPYLSDLVDDWKKKDNRRVYNGAAGWPYLENADYWNTPDPRIQAWGAGLTSIINKEAPRTDYDFAQIIRPNMPTVSHEIGQWCVFPNFKEISKYTGVLKAKNFEIFQESLEKHGLKDMEDKFLYASGRLQTLCYKADIEAALRLPVLPDSNCSTYTISRDKEAPSSVFWTHSGITKGMYRRRISNVLQPHSPVNTITQNGMVQQRDIGSAHRDSPFRRTGNPRGDNPLEY